MTDGEVVFTCVDHTEIGVVDRGLLIEQTNGMGETSSILVPLEYLDQFVRAVQFYAGLAKSKCQAD